MPLEHSILSFSFGRLRSWFHFNSNDPSPSVPPPAKRHKRNPADEMICPVRLELPFDPVTAEDGHVYEKEAILGYFKSREGGQVISPYTNKPMGTKLLPATQHRNTIEILIENGTISGELAEDWKQKNKEKKAVEDTKRNADAGDGEAAEKLATIYYLGTTPGFKENMKMALEYYKVAHEAGIIKATAFLGEILVGGIGGVPKKEQLGIAYLSMAAAKSNLAAYKLGRAFAFGLHGLPVDKAEAGRWLGLVVNGTCTHHHLQSDCIEEARRILRELQNS